MVASETRKGEEAEVHLEHEPDIRIIEVSGLVKWFDV